jgi:tRNA(fMet)-specific endonuclease VapC
MRLCILDTDHISLTLRGHAAIADRLTYLQRSQWATSIVSIQEIFNDWITSLNDPRYQDRQVELYTRLWRSNEFFQGAQVLNFDPAADQIYQQLRQSDPRLHKRRLEKDVKIAAIAIANQAIVITRDRRNFEQVLGLQIED